MCTHFFQWLWFLINTNNFVNPTGGEHIWFILLILCFVLFWHWRWVTVSILEFWHDDSYTLRDLSQHHSNMFLSAFMTSLCCWKVKCCPGPILSAVWCCFNPASSYVFAVEKHSHNMELASFKHHCRKYNSQIMSSVWLLTDTVFKDLLTS